MSAIKFYLSKSDGSFIWVIGELWDRYRDRYTINIFDCDSEYKIILNRK